MARIRSIKPEFWSNEQVVECSTNARLLFIGLWNFCDDHGRHKFSPKTIKAEIFPADDFSSANILGMIEELTTNGLIRIYTVENAQYLLITGWHNQRIDKRQEPRYPAPPDSSDDHSTNDPRPFPPDRKDKKDRSGRDARARETDPDPDPPAPNPPPPKTEPAAAAAVSENDPSADQVTALQDMFTEEVVAVFGEEHRRAWPPATEYLDAREILSKDGVDGAFVRSVVNSGLKRRKAKGQGPPNGLGYFVKAVEEARNRPALSGSGGSVNGNGAYVPGTLDRIEQGKKIAAAGDFIRECEGRKLSDADAAKLVRAQKLWDDSREAIGLERQYTPKAENAEP